jgi:hypothetical protein
MCRARGGRKAGPGDSIAVTGDSGSPASSKRPTSLFDTAVPELFSNLERGRESLYRQFAFAEAPVGHSAEVKAIGLAPGVLAFGRFRTVEGGTRVLERFARVAGREVGFGKGDADVDGELSELASVGEKDAGFSIGDALAEVAKLAMSYAARVKAPELKFSFSRPIGMLLCVRQMLSRSNWRFSYNDASEETVASANVQFVISVKRLREVQSPSCLTYGPQKLDLH